MKMMPQGGSVLAWWGTHAAPACGPTRRQTKPFGEHGICSAHVVITRADFSSVLIRLTFPVVCWADVWKSYLHFASRQFLIFQQQRCCIMITEQLRAGMAWFNFSLLVNLHYTAGRVSPSRINSEQKKQCHVWATTLIVQSFIIYIILD